MPRSRLLPIGIVTLATTSLAHAHEGHGLFGPHWHATDVWGFVAVAALLAAAVWMSKK